MTPIDTDRYGLATAHNPKVAGSNPARGADLVDLPDTLCISTAILAGVDWGGRAACVAAALWPDRCAGLVTVNGYLTARADTHTWNADSPVSQS